MHLRLRRVLSDHTDITSKRTENYMAETTITHFADFPEDDLVAFGEKVRLVTGAVVYGLDPLQMEPDTVTVISQTAGPGSHSSASAGSEVKVDLAEAEWPRRGGRRSGPEVATQQAQHFAKLIGASLVGGVCETDGVSVNVWVRQFAATGWQSQ